KPEPRVASGDHDRFHAQNISAKLLSATCIPGRRRKMPTKPRTQRRKLPKQDRAKATVDALLQATAFILVREGYDRASTNRIAKKAGVNIASLYQYFPSKESLVAALIDRHLEAILQRMVVPLASIAAGRAVDTVCELARAYFAMHLADPKLNRALL